MSDVKTFNAVKREKAGKGAARAVRRQGLVPAVIYGDKKAPELVSLDPRDLMKEMHGSGFWTSQFEIKVGSKKHRTICQDVQFHPVTDAPLHVDFLRISKDSEIVVAVPVKLLNEEKCPGIKLGGVLNVVRREVEVSCKATDIPQEITIDLIGAGMGDAIKMSNVELPEGVEPTITDRDFTILTIVAPSGMKEEAGEEASEEETSEE